MLESEIEKMGDRKEAGTEVAEEDTEMKEAKEDAETKVAEEDAETDTVGVSTEAAGEDGGADRDMDP